VDGFFSKYKGICRKQVGATDSVTRERETNERRKKKRNIRGTILKGEENEKQVGISCRGGKKKTKTFVSIVPLKG